MFEKGRYRFGRGIATWQYSKALAMPSLTLSWTRILTVEVSSS